jgi:hypothetical protein
MYTCSLCRIDGKNVVLGSPHASVIFHHLIYLSCLFSSYSIAALVASLLPYYGRSSCIASQLLFGWLPGTDTSSKILEFQSCILNIHPVMPLYEIPPLVLLFEQCNDILSSIYQT